METLSRYKYNGRINRLNLSNGENMDKFINFATRFEWGSERHKVFLGSITLTPTKQTKKIREYDIPLFPFGMGATRSILLVKTPEDGYEYIKNCLRGNNSSKKVIHPMMAVLCARVQYYYAGCSYYSTLDFETNKIILVRDPEREYIPSYGDETFQFEVSKCTYRGALSEMPMNAPDMNQLFENFMNYPWKG